jgi:hypothetical protein
MSTFLVELPHDPSQCLEIQDQMAARGDDFYHQFEWGCMKGEHIGWGTLEAAYEGPIRAKLPEVLRDAARVHEVQAFTPEIVVRLHQMAM